MRGWGECRIRCDWFWLPASSQPRNHTSACSVHPLLCRNVDPKLILECNGRPDGVCSGPLQGVHELLPQPSEVLYITVLRDPVKRATSGLNYNRIVKANAGETGACWRAACAYFCRLTNSLQRGDVLQRRWQRQHSQHHCIWCALTLQTRVFLSCCEWLRRQL